MPDATSLETKSVPSLASGLADRAVQFLRRHAGLLVVLVFAICFLTPLLQSGFYGDDMINSCTAGFMRLSNFHMPGFLGAHIKDWMLNGRFFPGAVAITYVVHRSFMTAVPYKAFLLVVILSNLIEFYYLLRCWKVNRAAAQLGTLSFVLLLQMRLFPDPVLSFAGIMQFLAGELLLSMICLQKYLDSKQRRWLFASALIYFAALITYEVSYLFLPIYLVMAYAHGRQWRAALAAVRPHFVAALVLAAFVLGLRHHIHMPAGHAYRLNFDPAAFGGTLGRQASAALPLSYALLSDYRLSQFDAMRLVTRWDNWAMLLAGGGITFVLLRRLPRGPAAAVGMSLGRMLTVASLICILPALLIAASPKYQVWIQYTGIGYLPVYVQYMGVAMFVVAGLLWFSAHFAPGRAALALGFIAANACVACITFDTNRQVVHVMQVGSESDSRQNMEQALAAGVADEVPAGATIMTTTWHPWLFDGPPASSHFFTQFVRRKTYAVNLAAGPPGQRPLEQQLAEKKSPSYHTVPPPTFVAIELNLNHDTGYVLVGELEPESDFEPQSGARAERKFGVRKFRIFVRGALTSLRRDLLPGAIIGRSLPTADDDAGGALQRIEFPQLTGVKGGPDWGLYLGNFEQPADVATVELSVVSAVAYRADGAKSR